MKHWIKRTLFGFAGLAVVAGSIAGCAGQRHGWSGNSAEFRARMVERVGSKLELDANQKQKLTVLAEKLQAQREAMRGAGGSGDPRSLVDEKTAAVRAGSPEIIAAAADFYDNLNPAQQQKVRDFMERGGRRWNRHG